MTARLLAVALTSLFASTAFAATTPTTSVANSRYVPNTSISTNSEALDQVSYSLGYLMGESNKDNVDDLRLDAFFQGFRDAYLAKNPSIDKAQMQNVLLDYQKRKEAEYAKQIEANAADNLAKQQAFMQDNAKKRAVTTTASGLQYQILTNGTGKRPKATDRVKVHYEGRLLDGTVFDSSYKRGEPAVFPLNQVIKGWTEGLQLMQAGSKYRLFVPASLAYGAAGNSDIEPNSLLIFDVELLEINPKPIAQEK